MKTIDTIIAELDERDLLIDAKRIARAHHVTLPEMFGASKERACIRARWAFWAWLADQGIWSHNRIAALCGRDHCTVDHGIRQHRGIGQSANRLSAAKKIDATSNQEAPCTYGCQENNALPVDRASHEELVAGGGE